MSNPRRLTTRCPLLAACLAVVALALVPSYAFAKTYGGGPIEASLDGPGLGAPIRFGDWDEEAPLAPGVVEFAQAAGFIAAAYGQTSDPMLSRRPKGDLGPRYVVTYFMPGLTDGEDRIVQELYPYAKPNPVTYTAPGQSFLGTQKTRGGWYTATSPLAPPLTYLLVEAGLPRKPPAVANGSPAPWTILGSLAATAAVLGLATLSFVVVRRRPPATRGSGFSLTPVEDD